MTALLEIIGGEGPVLELLPEQSPTLEFPAPGPAMLELITGGTIVDQLRGLSGFAAGTPRAGTGGYGERIGGGVAPYAFLMSATNSKAVARIAATLGATLTVTKMGADNIETQVGRFVFAPGQRTAATFVDFGSIALNDYVSVYGPVVPDATLSDVSYRIVED